MDLYGISIWLAATASVAKADGNANLARIASQALDELQRLSKIEEAARAYVAAEYDDVEHGEKVWNDLVAVAGPGT